MKLVAVIATLGRDRELVALLDSLRAQTRLVDRIVIVDQNPDDRVAKVLSDYADLPMTHIHDPTLVGVNVSRNHGWQQVMGDVYFFPDDDCWYPPDACAKAIKLIAEKNADIVSGRAADQNGRSINGKFDRNGGWVDRSSAWFSQIEWMFFVRRPVLEKTGGFDEDIGPGAGTDWGANEVQDLSLAAMSHSFRQYYDPELIAHHDEIRLDRLTDRDVDRLSKYARGFGYVLGKHGYGYASLAWWMARPIVGAARNVVKANFKHARLQLRVSVERLLGYLEGRNRAVGRE